MINIYEFIENCREAGMDSNEAATAYSRACAEERERFLNEYYSDPVVMDGARQQDIIDMYRRER